MNTYISLSEPLTTTGPLAMITAEGDGLSAEDFENAPLAALAVMITTRASPVT